MLLTIGRVLFALLFIASGLSKFFDLGATAQIIEAKFVLPAFATPYAANLETMVGLTPFRLLAIFAASLELICGGMIALNLGTRVAAFVLLIFVALVTFYIHDFWNQSGGSARLENIVHVMKNISIAGALLMIIGQRAFDVAAPPAIYHNRIEL